jgi:hypothetical protein
VWRVTPEVRAVTDHAADRPYRLIVTDGPCRTLAQGEARYFASMIDPANRLREGDGAVQDGDL